MVLEEDGVTGKAPVKRKRAQEACSQDNITNGDGGHGDSPPPPLKIQKGYQNRPQFLKQEKPREKKEVVDKRGKGGPCNTRKKPMKSNNIKGEAHVRK